MNHNRTVLVVAFLIICTVMLSGCNQLPTIPIPGTPASGCPPPPGPVQSPPSYQEVVIQVMKNTISTDPYITTTFAGGKGLGSVVLMETTVIRSDCKVESGQVPNPQMGSTVKLMGTTGTDLVVVNVTMTDGMTYTVVNRLLPFQ
ncbi:MAG: hypothetical protein LUQ69_03265 [Methanoregulaceae archaeon]|nr:hypothetical protein [Methanoregulaceae archaeon]